MEIVLIIIQILAITACCLIALLSILFLFQLHWPSPVLWLIKIYSSALSPLLALIALLGAIAGIITGSIYISLTGIYGFLFFSIHVLRVTRPPDSATGVENAFGRKWNERIISSQKKHLLLRRSMFTLPNVPEPRIEKDFCFSTLDNGRKLLCDVWQPSSTISPSGLAFIYIHGGTWYLLDKDFGTRSFFRHLAAQGHVIMDVAYRLAPETDLMGMLHDVKKAINWMKEKSGAYGINSNRIVVGGGSAGGHLAMLAAYTSDKQQFTPGELMGKDLSVSAVVSLYGPTDLNAMYYHTNQHLTTRMAQDKPKKEVSAEMPAWLIKKMGKDYHRLGFDKGFANIGGFAQLLGGHPDECPEMYALYSPLTHINSNCPPTLLVHGMQDVLVPVSTAHNLYDKLLNEKIAVVMHLLPQTDHAFDLALPKISPSAHNAYYDVEHFLEWVLNNR